MYCATLMTSCFSGMPMHFHKTMQTTCCTYDIELSDEEGNCSSCPNLTLMRNVWIFFECDNDYDNFV